MKRLTIMSYNVENLFDTKNDSLKNDNDFLPDSDRRWTQTRYKTKINNIAKVIASIGKWDAPMLVGLCEVENDYVMTSLVDYSPLKEIGYDFLHYDSPDNRGIDVAMLYRPELFTPIISSPIQVNIGEDCSTRDILYTCGEIEGGVKLHVFQVHFPSRRGGEEETEPKRIAVAQTLRRTVDTLLNANTKASIIIMGDFNDYPNNSSVSEVLYAQKYEQGEEVDNSKLYNLAYVPHQEGIGTYNMRGEWGMLDQIIVSGALLNGSVELKVDINKGAQVFCPEWMMKYDYKHNDTVPLRTYNGMRYEGGFSDHLPIFISLIPSE